MHCDHLGNLPSALALLCFTASKLFIGKVFSLCSSTLLLLLHALMHCSELCWDNLLHHIALCREYIALLWKFNGISTVLYHSPIPDDCSKLWCVICGCHVWKDNTVC